MSKPNKTQTPKPADSSMYKITTALLMAIVAAFLLHIVDRNYSEVANIFLWEKGLLWAGVALAAVTVLGACGIVFGKGAWKTAGIFTTVFAALLCICSFSLYKYWIEPIGLWYFIFIGLGVLYCVFLLYPMDFFLIAAATTLSGGLFYLHGQKGYTSSSTVVLYVILAVLLAGVIFLTWKACSKNGKLMIGGKTLRLFNGNSAAMPLYFTCAVLLACIIASLIFGSTFAFYCVYAAVGGLFVAACYYTIHLN